MTLHPDILTDLVILYHAGEASQASRALLEEEAARNAQLAAALASPSRVMAALPANPAPDERKVWRKVRLRYLAVSFAVAWTMALLTLVAFVPRLVGPGAGLQIAMAVVPFAVFALFAAGALGSLYFLIRAVR